MISVSTTTTAVDPGLLEVSVGLGLFCQLLQREETMPPTLVTEPDDEYCVRRVSRRDHFRMMHVYRPKLLADVVVVVLFFDLVTVLQQTDWCSSGEKKEVLSMAAAAAAALH